MRSDISLAILALLLTVLTFSSVTLTPARGYEPQQRRTPSPTPPGGNLILFEFSGSLWTMRPDGSLRTLLARELAYRRPVYSPDGKLIAVTFEPGIISALHQIHILNADGSMAFQLTDGALGKDRFDAAYPSWSPDGQQVVFRGSVINPVTGGKVAGIYVMGIDGSGLKRIVDNAAYPDADEPAWSPDGELIAFVAFDRATPGNKDIFVAARDGGEVTRLTNNGADDFYPAWSRDGKQIAFVSARDDNFEIYVMNANGSGQRRLTRFIGPDTQPSWSADGRRVVFVSKRQRDQYNTIYVMERNGSRLRRLSSGNTPNWQPITR
jgi:Tol biopolymer transport system component